MPGGAVYRITVIDDIAADIRRHKMRKVIEDRRFYVILVRIQPEGTAQSRVNDHQHGAQYAGQKQRKPAGKSSEFLRHIDLLTGNLGGKSGKSVH